MLYICGGYALPSPTPFVISRLDSAGRNIEDFYYNKPRSGSFRWENVDGDVIEEGDAMFTPGNGFSVDGDDGYTITIPGPTL